MFCICICLHKRYFTSYNFQSCRCRITQTWVYHLISFIFHFIFLWGFMKRQLLLHVAILFWNVAHVVDIKLQFVVTLKRKQWCGVPKFWNKAMLSRIAFYKCFTRIKMIFDCLNVFLHTVLYILFWHPYFGRKSHNLLCLLAYLAEVQCNNKIIIKDR